MAAVPEDHSGPGALMLRYLVTVRDAVVVWFNPPFSPLIVSV